MLPLHTCRKWDGLDSVTTKTNPECSLQTIRSRCLSNYSLDKVLLRVLDDNFGLSGSEISDDEEEVVVSSYLSFYKWIYCMQ